MIEVRDTSARARDEGYEGKAWLALALYCLGLPGLVANLLWWESARQRERHSGIRPAGKGCLDALLLGCGLPTVLFAVVVSGLLALATLGVIH